MLATMGCWSKFRRLIQSKARKNKTTSLEIPPVEENLPIFDVPVTQTILLLHAPKQPYQVTSEWPVPELKGNHEVLVKTEAIGLNPIDWKAPDYNFAIPELPYISGRELAGQIVKVSPSSHLKPGERAIAISTDYRDPRKAAYQEYVVAFDYNVVKIPPSMSAEDGSTLGVAFVAAALGLGVCAGVDFSSVLGGPDLLKVVRSVPYDSLPNDVRGECLDNICESERAKRGDWLAVWGGSAVSANLTIQLAHLAGLKVVVIVDKAKHGLRLSNHAILKADLLIDSHDPQRAVDIIRANVGDTLRFGFDTRGRETATHLLRALSPSSVSLDSGAGKSKSSSSLPSPPATPPSGILSAHLIGLTGLPKETPPTGTVFHTVPIKLFHEVPEVGRSLVIWLEKLLANDLVVPPEIIDIEEGFEGVNRGLDRMRRGEISGGKMVVRLC